MKIGLSEHVLCSSRKYFTPFLVLLNTKNLREIPITPVRGVRIFSGTEHGNGILLWLWHLPNCRFCIIYFMARQLTSCTMLKKINRDLQKTDNLLFLQVQRKLEFFLESVMIMYDFSVFAAIFFPCSTRAKFDANSNSWKHNFNYFIVVI